MSYYQKFEDDFRELFVISLRENEAFGKELWSALANVAWRNKNDPNNTECAYSFRAAGSLVASMLYNSHYMDWYCTSPDAVVSEYISNAMTSKGWSYNILKCQKNIG